MILRRLNLFEFNDAPWTPHVLRTTIVEFLHHMALKLGMYRAAFDVVADVVASTGESKVQLLCAGAGGGATLLSERLGDCRVVLSDLFPQVDEYRKLGSADPRIEHVACSVDVRDVPAEMQGVRTIINAIHHLRPDDVRAVLQDAVRKRQPLVVIEPVQREALPLLRFLVAAPVLCAALSAWIRPLALRRLLLGLFIPVGSACFVFDGVVSHLRAYTLEEWAVMIDELDDAHTFEWRLTYAPSALGARLTVLKGVPA